MKLAEAWKIYLSFKDSFKMSREINRWDSKVDTFFINHELEEITSLKLMEYKLFLHRKGLSPQSIKHCLGLVLRVLRFASKYDIFKGLIPSIDFPKFDNKRVRFLSRDEASVLFQSLRIKSEFWHDIALFALNTGMRAGEIFNVKISDCDMSHRFITLFTTKNTRTRTVPLNDTAIALINNYRQRKNMTEYLFTSQHGKIKEVHRIFREAVNECKLNVGISDRRNKIVFHSLRHTYASWLVQEGAAIALVSQLLGHSNIQMTMRYAHLAPDAAHSIVAVLDNYRVAFAPQYN